MSELGKSPPRGAVPGKSLVFALGNIALTVMPCSFSSPDSTIVKPRIPALAVEYAKLGRPKGGQEKAAREEILIILPLFCFVISKAAALVQMKCPFK